MQTAVEWLDEQLQNLMKVDYGLVDGRCLSIPIDKYMELKQQAKEIEKQQIIDAHKDGAMFEMDADKIGKDYYNETYGSKGSDEVVSFNKDKRFSEEDMRKAIEMARQIKDDSAHDTFTAEDISGCTEVCTYGWREKYSDDDIISSLTQPKDTWGVEFINGQLKLK